MSIKILRSEIARFLSTEDAEVLVVKGAWGVGKTFAWKALLAEATDQGKFKLKNYSYVSLFGLNSLEDLRYSIFENTVPIARSADGPDESTFAFLMSKASEFWRKLKPVAELGAGIFNKKGITDVIFRSMFLTVRNQIVCIDDLERRGEGLKVKDVMGLASFLNVERGCKVVLLLNDGALGNEKDDFEKQLEKVADVSMTFLPSAPESISIALTTADELDELLAVNIQKLEITNIRVIKKIERFARLSGRLLPDCDQNVRKQFVATVVLGAWCVHEPDRAPPLDFVRRYSSIAFTMNSKNVKDEEIPWDELLTMYGFSHADEFDDAILDSVANGYFDEERIRVEAEKAKKKLRQNSDDDAYSKAWSTYHTTLAVEDDVVLDAIYRGGLETIDNISLVNLNATLLLFHEMDWSDEADKFLGAYMDHHRNDPIDFFDIRNHHTGMFDTIDERLAEAFKQKLDGYVDKREPRDVLLNIAESKSFGRRDLPLFEALGAAGLEALIYKIEGKLLRPAIEMLLAMSRSKGEKGSEVIISVLEAIAAKSPLRKRRFRSWGLKLAPDVQVDIAEE
ncbi:hypothetical protein NFO65_18500 [Neorhizobium galegae]|uniref:hypothetical protein n=1 Tax=Neorhizobium galegae TaxID=399 RepID=UPI002100A2E9|nr:hypothetical protein [Neorhizobium galegae]MCQ1572723.1 hypothetical protein [Neorhizobium galegae]